MNEQMNLASALLDEAISAFRSGTPGHTEAVGKPWSEDKIGTVLTRLKAARVEPHCLQVELRDTIAQIDLASPETISCVALTSDESGYKLAFAGERNEFVLIQRSNGNSWRTINIWGDAVGCYAAM